MPDESKQKEKHPILLVDDEPEILQSLLGLLRREFVLYTAESGAQALEILKEHAVHVIMTDQRMPEMTGVQLMGEVETKYPDAMRIVFTGYADIKAVIEAINSGGLFRYITKPWDPDELLVVLHEAADRYDEIVQRRQFLLDVRSHLEQGEQLLGSLEQRDDVAQFDHNAKNLLARVKRAIESEA